MADEQRVLIRCDAPHCDRTLEGLDGQVLFDSLDAALEVAEERDWLVTRATRDAEQIRATYCPLHWHRQFGVRSPYWGAPRRRFLR